MNERQALRQARTLIVKIGTAIILGPRGKPNGELLLPLAREIAALRAQGRAVVIVSSGAVGLGRASLQRRRLAEAEPGETLAQKQALAAIGQVELMNVWGRIFDLLDIPVAQVLLTGEDLRERDRYLNARHTLLTLLDSNILPIINENDSVATAEIKFGDNDILACLVGSLVDAQAVVNLTSAPGLLRPQSGRPLEEWPVVRRVDEISEEVRALVSTEKTAVGTGGMASKLEAARVAMEYGGMMVIARAGEDRVLTRLLAGEDLGTVFMPAQEKLGGRKRWLAAGGRPRGRLVLDAGAVRAVVSQGRSLLPVGIATVEGRFGPGDLVTVCGPEGRELGRGLVNYASGDLERLKGQASARIEEILGFKAYDEAIHRDNLYIGKAARKAAGEE